MKQGTVIVALAATIGLAATACSSDGGSDSTSSAATTTSASTTSAPTSGGEAIELTITANAIKDGKNAAEAAFYTDWVIPQFESQMAEEGKNVTVKFLENGVDDEAYKTKMALDLKSGQGADIISLDGIWIGEFADAGYIKPLNAIAGDQADTWDGWDQIPDAVQQALSYDGERYGIPLGADGRLLYFSKTLFEQAGLPTDWKPTSWNDIIDAAKALKEAGVTTPLQINAGTAMGEATTMQGILPLLVGTGAKIYEDDKWLGDSQQLRDVLSLYKTVYIDDALGDPVYQLEANGRDETFAAFAAGEIGILAEGDYFWRSVINPDGGTAPMTDRDTAVGYTQIPAQTAGSGINGQDFVSMSGGAGRVINPNTKHADEAWALLALINSKEGFEARVAESPSITPRADVNAEVLADNPMLKWVSDVVLPTTAYRPGLAVYPQVSTLLQEATNTIVSGGSVDDAVAAYQSGLEALVGADNVASS